VGQGRCHVKEQKEGCQDGIETARGIATLPAFRGRRKKKGGGKQILQNG